jgi:hypothetical protein
MYKVSPDLPFNETWEEIVQYLQSTILCIIMNDKARRIAWVNSMSVLCLLSAELIVPWKVQEQNS